MQVNNHELYIKDQGPKIGPVVVLLHHGLGNTRAWRRQTGALASAGMRVISYDRWGYGKSDARPGLDIPEFQNDQDDLLKIFELLQIQDAVLVGHSDGGSIALAFTAWRPERVRGLVTIAAHIYVEPKMQPGIEGIRNAYEHDSDFQGKFREAHGEKWQAVFNNWYNGWKQPKNLAWDLRPVLGKISCPTLVIQGKEDEHASPQHARDLAACIPGAALWMAPGVGHMLQREIPAELNQRLLAFIHNELEPARVAKTG